MLSTKYCSYCWILRGLHALTIPAYIIIFSAGRRGWRTAPNVPPQTLYVDEFPSLHCIGHVKCTSPHGRVHLQHALSLPFLTTLSPLPHTQGKCQTLPHHPPPSLCSHSHSHPLGPAPKCRGAARWASAPEPAEQLFTSSGKWMKYVQLISSTLWFLNFILTSNN